MSNARAFHQGCPGIRSDRASKDDNGVFRFETLKERDCHDTLCVLFFIGMWVLAGLLAHAGFAQGHPARLVYATDYAGDICGVGAYAAKKFIYYPGLHTAGLPLGRCLEECPFKHEKVCVPISLPFGHTMEKCATLASDSKSYMFRCLSAIEYTKLLSIQCGAFATNGSATTAPTPAPTPVSCANDVRDNDETDVDCGGVACTRCGPGGSCADATDCLSGRCGSGGTCAALCPGAGSVGVGAFKGAWSGNMSGTAVGQLLGAFEGTVQLRGTFQGTFDGDMQIVGSTAVEKQPAPGQSVFDSLDTYRYVELQGAFNGTILGSVVFNIHGNGALDAVLRVECSQGPARRRLEGANVSRLLPPQRLHAPSAPACRAARSMATMLRAKLDALPRPLDAEMRVSVEHDLANAVVKPCGGGQEQQQEDEEEQSAALAMTEQAEESTAALSIEDPWLEEGDETSLTADDHLSLREVVGRRLLVGSLGATASPTAPPTKTQCSGYSAEWPGDRVAAGVLPCSVTGEFRKIRCGDALADPQDPAVIAKCEAELRHAYPHCVDYTLEQGKYSDQNLNQHPIYMSLQAGGAQLMFLFGELQKSASLVFLCGGIIAAALSLMWLFNVQKVGIQFIRYIMIATLCLSVLVLAVLSVVLFVLAGSISLEPLATIAKSGAVGGAVEASELQVTPDENAEMYRRGGIAFAVLTVLAAALVASLWEKIAIAIAIVRLAAKTVRSMPLLSIFPIFSTIVTSGVLAFGLLSCAYVLSVPSDTGSNATLTNATFSVGTLASVTSNHTAAATAFVSAAAAGTIVFDLQTKAATMSLVIFMCWWSLEVLRGLGTMTIAGAASKWYWAKEGWTREGSKFPILGGFIRAICNHIGSIIFGAFVLRAAELLMMAVTYLKEKLPKSGSGSSAAVVSCCLGCIACCIAKCIQFLTTSAYIVIAIQGGSFWASTKRAFRLMHSQLRLLAMVSFASSILMALVKLSIALICAALVLLVLSFASGIPNWFFQDAGMTEVRSVKQPALPVAVTFFFAYTVAESFLDVFVTTIDTIFICYCCDIKLNKEGGTLARPMLALESIKQTQEHVHQEKEKFRRVVKSAESDARRAEEKEDKGQLDSLQTTDPDPDEVNVHLTFRKKTDPSKGQKVVV